MNAGNTLRNRAMVATALCAIADEEMQRGDLKRATETVMTIRKMVAEIGAIVDVYTGQLSRESVRETSELLAGLDDRVAAIERAVRPQTIQ